MWRTFKNPWTKDVRYIISKNSLVLSETGLAESTIANDVIPTKFSFPGCFNEFLGDESCHGGRDPGRGGGVRQCRQFVQPDLGEEDRPTDRL